VHDVLIVGGGPAGSSCAYWLADAGWDVVVVEKKRLPREKTCGDGLTPRAVRQLADMGVEQSLTGAHRFVGLRSCGFGQVLEMPWPQHPAFPSYGYTITRHDLDVLVADRAAKAGADVRQATEALAPLEPVRPGPLLPIGEPAERPPRSNTTGRRAGGDPGDSLASCAGAVVHDRGTGESREVRARYVVVADGANSRFGRSLGASRDRDHPLGMALRGYYRSPRHDEDLIESHLDIRDADGQVVPGYGWIFPLGDGRVNVGVGLLSTDRRWKGVNTTRLMDAFVQGAPMSVGPRHGTNTLVIGDAGGSINPFNGEGIAYGYETGRLAAASIGEALRGDGHAALVRYEQRLDDAYGPYFTVAEAFVRMISDPRTMRLCVSLGMRSELLMRLLLRIMANLMRPDALGAAEMSYRAMLAVANLLPDKATAALDEIVAASA
jgi:flavin-dependent dehydrogenase